MLTTLITAARGEGKTTFLTRYVRNLVGAGCSVGGIVSPAVFDGDERMGYDLIDLRTGDRRELSRVAAAERPDVGVYRFDVAAIDAGRRALISATSAALDVIAIDEVGPLEFRGQGWAPALEVVLGACSGCQELVVVVRPSLVDELPARFPSPLWAASRRISPPWPGDEGRLEPISG